VIANSEQLKVALDQLAGFKSTLEAMRRHLEEEAPSLVPLASESYQHRIQELQEEICDYLLRQHNGVSADEALPADATA
jgi:hemerythrin-like domain-containing protein